MKGVSRRILSLASLAACAGFPLSAQERGVEVTHMGENNTLVRVVGQGRYLLLPVEEAAEDARVDVLAGGRLEETIYVRLAKSRTDYTVPYDLTPLAGRCAALNIVTTQSRGSVRDQRDDASWRDIRLSDDFDTSNREKYRPLYHHSPLYGWMNDPNGMFYKDGEWHLYFQHNPYGSKWQNMTWGHSVSTDLVHWRHEAAAIRPSALGSIFSGSAVVDSRGTAGFGPGAVVALYTSAGTSQVQSLAYSTDNGATFSALPTNPVLAIGSEARDPKVIWHEPTGEWVMVLAHPLVGEMLFFGSKDLKTWEARGGFGQGLGAQGGVWECPDLFELPVEGTDERRWVLLCNINPGGPFGGNATQYFTGQFDGRTFTPDTDAEGRVPTKWMDHGKDHYATVSWSDAPDGRRTVIGWMSNWQYAAEVPTRQFRSANTLPRDVSLFRAADGQVYMASAPSPEVDRLRGTELRRAKQAALGAKAKTFDLPAANDGACEIALSLDASRAQDATLTLSNAAGDEVVMRYDAAAHTLSMDRARSGIVDFSEAFPATTVCPTHETAGKVDLRIFIDRSSIEVFGNGGRFVMTNIVFPRSPYERLSIVSTGRARASNVRVYPINVNN